MSSVMCYAKMVDWLNKDKTELDYRKGELVKAESSVVALKSIIKGMSCKK